MSDQRIYQEYHIDMSEYEKKNYKSYNEFFSRKIKEGKRPFPEDETILGSPCDCKVSVYPIEEKTSFVVRIQDIRWIH